MSKIRAVPVDPATAPARVISPRLRSQLIYFVADSGPEGPVDNEYGFNPAEVDAWLDEGVFYLISPLDTANRTEVEITEEQEEFLGWIKEHGVRRVRIEE